MKKSILAACVAASLFGCDEQKPAATTETRIAPRVEKIAAPTAAPKAVDAGSFVALLEEPPPGLVVGIGIPHEQPQIDHLARAKSLRELGDLSGALTEARRAVYSAPSDTEALTFVARVASTTGQHLMAADAWAQISEVNTDDASPRIQEARCRLRGKDSVGATVAALDAIARDPGAPEAHQVHGRAALARGELQEAIDAFEKVVALKPDHGHALNNLGFAYLRANENDAAVQVLERAAQALPNVAYVHNNLGIALERVGRKEEAKSAYLSATTLSPKYVKARVNMNRVAKAEPSTEPVAVPEPTNSEE